MNLKLFLERYEELLDLLRGRKVPIVNVPVVLNSIAVNGRIILGRGGKIDLDELKKHCRIRQNKEIEALIELCEKRGFGNE